MEKANALHVRFWDAVNACASAACLSVTRQKAVADVERIVEEIESAARAAERAKVLGAIGAVLDREGKVAMNGNARAFMYGVIEKLRGAP